MNPEPADWTSFKGVWERASNIRSFIWTQDSPDEGVLLGQFLVRLRQLFHVDFCFIALRREDGKIVQAGAPEEALERLPPDFVRRAMELVASSRVPVRWSRLEAKTEYRSVMVSPLSPPVGQPLGFLMMGDSRARDLNDAELFWIQSLAGEVSWAIRELRVKQNHRKMLSAASLELKNSLNAVLRECSLSRKVEAAAAMAEHDQALNIISRNTQEALRAIGSFLDSAVEQQGRLSVLREPIELVTLVDHALHDCREKAERAGWGLETQYAEDLPRTYVTDPARFRHVLREIVNYAVGIAVSTPLLVQVRHNTDFIEINVAVNGTPVEAAAESPERVETVRENLKLLNGHLHLVKLPGGRLEIGLCLPKGEQMEKGCGISNFVGK